MSLIPFPSWPVPASVDWTLQQPTMVNVSEWSGRRQVLRKSWARWRASVRMPTLVTEPQVEEWRAFLAELEGRANIFRLGACERQQLVRPNVYNPIRHVVRAAGFYAQPPWGLNVGLFNADGQVAGALGKYNVAVYNGMVGAWQTQGFNTHDPAQAAAMAAHLVNIGNNLTNYPLIIYSFDEPWANRTDTLKAAMYAHGASPAIFGNPGFAAQSAYVLVTRVNAGQGGGRELYVGPGTRNAWIETDFYIAANGLISFEGYDLSNLDTPLEHATIQVAEPNATGTTLLAANLWENGLLLRRGQFITVEGQLLQLTANAIGTGGLTRFEFRPRLRAAPRYGASVEVFRPYATMALASDVAGWSVGPGQAYGIAFDCEEAF
jgi:hypothetical protein